MNIGDRIPDVLGIEELSELGYEIIGVSKTDRHWRNWKR